MNWARIFVNRAKEKRKYKDRRKTKEIKLESHHTICKKCEISSKDRIPASHGWGFCPIPSLLSPDSSNYILFAGCDWKEESSNENFGSSEYKFFYCFDPSTRRFEKIQKSVPVEKRYRHSICTRTNEKNEREMLVFGGVVGGDFSSELIKYNFLTKQWSEIKPRNKEGEGIYKVAFHQALYQNVLKRMIVYAGKNNRGRLSNVWFFDFCSDLWSRANIGIRKRPCERGGHCMNWLDKTQKKFISFGGINNKDDDLNDVNIFDCFNDKWEVIDLEVKGKRPAGRASHSSVVFKNRFYIFAGAGNSKNGDLTELVLLNDLHVLDLNNNTWREIEIGGDIPKKVYIHRSGVFIRDGIYKMFSIGGIDENRSSVNTLYEFEFEKRELNHKEFFLKKLLSKKFSDVKIILST